MTQHILPATILDSGELRKCYDCGADLAGKQAHFDREGEAYCMICAEKPRCRYCDQRVDEHGQVHAGGCGRIG